MNATAFGQKTNPNFTNFQVQQTFPTEEELRQQIEQFIQEDYRGYRKLPVRIIFTAAIGIIIFGAIWLAWL